MKAIDYNEIVKHLKSISIEKGKVKHGVIDPLSKEIGVSYHALYKVVRGLRKGDRETVTKLINWWITKKR